MSEPRRHHFLPATYLAGFVSPDEQTLSVIGVDGKRRTATPGSTAFERDLYRVEGVPGLEPNDFEKDFASLEGAFASVLRLIVSSERLPDQHTGDYSTLISFMALTAVRGPALRDGVNQTVRSLAENAAREIQSSPQRLVEAIATAKAEGAQVPDDALEQMQRLEIGREISLEIPNTFFMQTLFKGLPSLEAALSARSWTLLKSRDSDLVTCDRPLGVTSASPDRDGRPKPDYRVADTVLTFPLTRRLLLFSDAAGTGVGLSSFAVSIDRQEVASLNSRTISMMDRFVCWPGGRLLWITKDGALGDADQLVEALRWVDSLKGATSNHPVAERRPTGRHTERTTTDRGKEARLYKRLSPRE